MSKKYKILCVCLSSLIFIISFVWLILIWRIDYCYTLEYKDTSLTHVEYNITAPDNVTYDSLQKEINDLLDYDSYTLTYDTLSYNIYGKTNLFSKCITLKAQLSYALFTFSLTHEITHLKYFTSNERFVNYMSFKVLYESENEYFKNIALYALNLDICNSFPYDYSFAGYAEEIL